MAGRDGWAEAWVRIDSVDAAVLDMLALGAEVEVMHPPYSARSASGETALRIADLQAGPGAGAPPPAQASGGGADHGPN